MKISASKVLAAALLAGVALPALGQDRPESLLPPGFDRPAPTPTPSAAPAPPRAPEAAPAPALPAPEGGAPAVDESDAGDATANQTQAAAAVDLTKYELPDFAKRSLDRVGAVAWNNPPFGARAFGAQDGRFLQVLMRRLDAPVASRWVSIALRRATMSRIDTPSHVDGADFAAERAWLLLRMGEANAARAVVQDVDVDNYTPKLFQVAMQVAAATADPAALCPLADQVPDRLENERGWPLARAICAGLAGRPNQAGQLLNQARWGTSQNDIDTLLAEKVMGAGPGGRRSVTVEWAGVDKLTAWRWGMATATGVDVPAELYDTAGPQVRYWHAVAPQPDPLTRVYDAELAAAAGVFSSAGLVDLYSEIDQIDGATGPAVAAARDLRNAYAAGDAAARVAAIRSLWDGAQGARSRYGRMILTARAAAGIAPDKDRAADADELIGSMLSAGLDQAAIEWQGLVKRGSLGWALLALADPAEGAPASYSDASSFTSRTDSRRAQLFAAAMAGLGRLSDSDAERLARSADVQIGGANDWTRAIDAAARRHEQGTVVLLSAVGMQSRGWGAVTPEALFHIVAAMRVAGLGNYARMVAVEAVARA